MEFVVQRIAGFQLFAVDQQGIGRGNGLPVVSSKLRNSGRRPFSSVLVPSSFCAETRYEVVDELRDRGVLADHDEARRHLDAGVPPKQKVFS